MILLIRFILVGMIVYLLFRSFAGYFADEERKRHEKERDQMKEQKPKGVSKDIGEYTDYEEIKD